MSDDTAAYMGWGLSAQEQIDGFRREVRELKAENALLWEQGSQLFDKTLELATENDRLRELVADMLMCLTWQYEPHGYMEDGCNCCRFRGKTHGECGLGMFRGRSSELGVEVNE